MNVYNSLSDLPNFKNAVLTIGSFDGVHAGHQKILERINQLAKKNEGRSIVITFHPHPRKVTSSVPGEIKQLKESLSQLYGNVEPVTIDITPEPSD